MSATSIEAPNTRGTEKPILVGGIGERNYGKQYRQGNRIYSAEGIAMACLAQPIGNKGGNSYLYVVYEEIGED